MLATGRRLSEDPAAAAAGLILRLGIAILALAVPCGAVISRRLLFVLMPVGAALMLIGGLLQPCERGRLVAVRGLVFSPLVQAMAFLVLWAGFSLLWTPFPELAIERFLKTAGTVAVAAMAIAALPHQVKASNSNLLPIGVAAAAIAIEMFVITFFLLWPRGYFWTQQGYEFALLWMLLAIAIFFRGGGELSVDRLLKKEL